ncbi:MAG: hypothetical protein ACI9D0_001712, partial [Bacteroidia bacterium]
MKPNPPRTKSSLSMREVLGAVVASLIVAGALFSYRVDRMPGDA